MSTADIEESKACLDRDGYCVVPRVLDPKQVSALRDALDIIAEHERERGTAWFSHNNQRIFMLLNKGREFFDLLDMQPMTALLEYLLGEHYLLSSITANIANPGNRAQPAHTDQGYIPEPWVRPEAANVAWVIDEFTERNGATYVISGTHRDPSKKGSKEKRLSVVAEPGSVICLDGRIWHGTGTNKTESTQRRAIFTYYCRPYIRQQENFSRSLDRSLLASLTQRQRALLGFDIWLGLGSVSGLPIEWMDGRERIGPTNADRLF